MEEETNLNETNSQEVIDASGESSGEVDASKGVGQKPLEEDFTKQKIEETLGRKFSSLEDALKTVKNTYAESSRLAQELTRQKEAKLKATPPASEEYSQLRDEVQELKFAQKYPDATAYLEKVKKIAKSEGTDYVLAFETSGLKEVFDTKKAQEAQKEGELNKIPQGNQKIGIQSEELQKENEELRRGNTKPAISRLTKKIFGEE